MTLRLAFMGTPDFAVPALKALHRAGHEIAAVYSQPPRRAGRGQKERPSPVQAAAEAMNIEVRTPESLKTAEAQQAFAALDLDAAVVVAYGLILPPAILEAPRLGCLNIHASLLPRWRGAAPIQRAIEAGDAKTGITVMQMDEDLDSGAICLRAAEPIWADTNTVGLHMNLAFLGADKIVEAMKALEAGELHCSPQPEEGVTYAAKLTREEGRLDWNQPAEVLERKVRAFKPWPGAWFEAAGERIKVLQAEVSKIQVPGPPGSRLPGVLVIRCGEDSTLRIGQVQRAGKKPMLAAEMLNGLPLPERLA